MLRHTLLRRVLPAALLSFVLGFAGARAQGPDPITLAATTHTYANDDTTSLVEFDYQFDAAKLVARPDVKSGERLVRVHFRLHLVPDGVGAPAAIEWRVTAVREELTSQMIVGVKSLEVRPGHYAATLEAIDENAGGATPVATLPALPLDVTKFSTAKPTLSDIEIAEDIHNDEGEPGPYSKSGLVVIPRVTRMFTTEDFEMRVYLELYNAARARSPQLLLRLRLNRMVNGQVRGIISERSQIIDRPDSGIVIITEAFPLDSLKGGDYAAVAILYDGVPPNAVDSSLVGRGLYVVGKDDPSAVPDISTIAIDPMYAGKKESELDEEWTMISYIASPLETRLWQGLTGADAKARFLSRFWGGRDESPETPENEFRTSYMKRVDEARRKYASPTVRKGWESDRGRVLLQYGAPLSIDRHPQDFNIRPYEVWSYNQYEFVFLDRSQHGDYRLVHSTAPNEVSHTEWLKDFGRLNKEWEESGPK